MLRAMPRRSLWSLCILSSRGFPVSARCNLGSFSASYPIITIQVFFHFAFLFYINLADVGVQADFAGAFAVGIVAALVGAAVYADFSDIC